MRIRALSLLERLRSQFPADRVVHAPTVETLERKDGRSLPLGYQYAGGCGAKAQRRYLAQRLKKIQKIVKSDPDARVAFARLMRATDGVPEEFGIVHGTWQNLALSALTASEETRSSWADALDVLLDKFEEGGDPDGQVQGEDATASEEQAEAPSAEEGAAILR